jgi:phage I-like protein
MKRHPAPPRTAFLAVLADVSTVDAGGWLKMIPMGQFSARDGRGPWLLKDKAHADQVVAATLARAAGTDLVIDYDHQSEFALKLEGGVAPASGWMKDLQARADGIYAKVEWTAPASAKIDAKEYRYLSPVFAYGQAAKAGGPAPVLGLLRAGLTNNPALSELGAVASEAFIDPEEQAEMLKTIALALGLPETATEADILAVCGTLTATQTSMKAIAASVGLADTADNTAICAAVTKAKADGEPDPSKYVPLSVVTALQTQVNALTTGAATDKAVLAVDAAIEAGKVTPANREWALGYAAKDPAGFAEFVGKAPAVLSSAALKGGKVDPETITLTDDDKAVCAALGVSQEDFLATRKKEAAL